jgi:outer membrane protein, heavy metal efflux system
MIKQFLFMLSIIVTAQLFSQSEAVPLAGTMNLDSLVAEAIRNNPDIRAAVAGIEMKKAGLAKAGTLEDPELTYMREGMPDFKFNDAMYSRIELMQMIPFPTKFGVQNDIARIQLDASTAEREEIVNDVRSKLRSMYAELWNTQQNISLANDNRNLMEQFVAAARTKYATGEVHRQDLLKAQVELAMIDNEVISLRQKELSAKAMLVSYLDRRENDTLRTAALPRSTGIPFSLDELLATSRVNRPMLQRDSLMIRESEKMRTMAKQEYLPDFNVGIERMTEPMGSFTGWSVSVGMTIPFAPWTLGKANARVEEADAAVRKSTAEFNATRTMVESRIKDFFYKSEAASRQLAMYDSTILPQARQSFQATLVSYRTGTTDYLMLLDAYRTLNDLSKEYLMTRMQFEQAMAELEKETGGQNLSNGK